MKRVAAAETIMCEYSWKKIVSAQSCVRAFVLANPLKLRRNYRETSKVVTETEYMYVEYGVRGFVRRLCHLFEFDVQHASLHVKQTFMEDVLFGLTLHRTDYSYTADSKSHKSNIHNFIVRWCAKIFHLLA